METKNVMIICVTIIICLCIAVGAYIFIFSSTVDTSISADISSSLVNGDKITFSLKDNESKPLDNKTLVLIFTNSKNNTFNKTIKTNSKGKAIYKVDLPEEKYSVICKFEGDNSYKQSSFKSKFTVEKKENPSEVVTWVEDIDLSFEAGCDYHIYVTHYADGTCSWTDGVGYHRVPESQFADVFGN